MIYRIYRVAGMSESKPYYMSETGYRFGEFLSVTDSVTACNFPNFCITKFRFLFDLDWQSITCDRSKEYPVKELQSAT